MKHIILSCISAALLALASGCAELTTNKGSGYGSPMDPAQAEFTITITESTRYVNVEKFHTVKFVIRSADGRQSIFGWRFDTFDAPIFPLAEIAPAGTLGARAIQVYVDPQRIPRS